MLVTIYPPSRHTLKAIDSQFALQQDNWNDYSFMTLYHLYYNTTGEDATLIGGVKILRRGQTEADSLQVKNSFNALDEDYCSVGTSLDYYQRLNSLPDDVRTNLVGALRDVAVHSELRDSFSSEPGWQKSLFRDNSNWRRFLDDAHALYYNNFSALVDAQEPFSFQPGPGSSEIELNFSADHPSLFFVPHREKGPSGRRGLLPERVIVLVGRNGSGKSTLLSRIAHVAFAAPEERSTPKICRLGQFMPDAIGFMRIITVSYSAFDSFTIPGDREDTLSQTARDIEKGEGRFVFCGLRDIVAEARHDIGQAKDLDPPTPDEMLRIEDRRTSTRLKSIEQLADEFAKLVQRIKGANRQPLFRAALEPLLQDPSFSELDVEGLHEALTEDAREAFLAWSTGHKIALHVVASLVAYAVPRSLVLFDEPEMHLHPPLAAALMHSVRLILEEANAVCIVATHSPVMLQETMARHVRVVQRVGDTLHVRHPRMETFGENIGILTYDTFGLTASNSDFHMTLDRLADGLRSLDEIDPIFSPGLSNQARAYVLARLAAGEDK
ncbi:ATP-binding protein [Pseudoxanthomonas winnipegensis]|jgi:energy-coupling factor transporter ATP-binding protein EcfA2|uniref:ATP-binding protein n=1 Tax=Pseudoxanthomonas winnipegensis TaxID=2480810 RepID=A0ABY1WF13_9GAMM|nr:AAA family ATPase [Pseudoxanthomonas winnipegensis]TAA08842.1 ATP-binding protein [Pseudoxanthomonas winnipegensis]TAA20542.1 ATP-binding protein [Pseudoxanthomonas winnipegensis]TAH71804.1 ATP-binding protein [Pseudoxanthomonas winnipegensis]